MQSDLSRPISIVVPVYQPNPRLKSLLEEFATGLVGVVSSLEFVIVLDTGSLELWSELIEILEGCSGPYLVRKIRLVRNFGQTIATWVGVCEAKGSIVITVNDDFEHSPREAVRLMDTLLQSSPADVIIGCGNKVRESGTALMSSRFMQALQSSVQGVPRGLRTSSFIAYKKSAVERARLLDMWAVFPGWQLQALNPTFLEVAMASELENSHYNLRFRVREFSRFAMFFLRTRFTLVVLGGVSIFLTSQGFAEALIGISLATFVLALALNRNRHGAHAYKRIQRA